MPALKISKRTVEAAPVPAVADAYYWDTELTGFGLRVTRRGVRSYVIQYRVPGRAARRQTLGIHGKPWTADAARKEAEGRLIDAKKGRDPVEEKKRRQREARTLGVAGYLDHFTEHCLKAEWRDSWRTYRRALELHAMPHLKGKALPHITADDIAAIIDPLRPRKALARQVWAALSRFFSFAVEDRKLAKTANPMDEVRAPPAPDERTRLLSADEIFAAWRASFALADPWGPYIRLLFCTGQRRTEVSGLPWRELQRARGVWVVDAERAKNDQDNLVPLNASAMRELVAIGWKSRGSVFPAAAGKSTITGYSKTKRRLDALMLPLIQQRADARAAECGEDPAPAVLERWTFHDVRRTMTTTMQSLGEPVEVTERCIAHKSGRSRTSANKPYHLWEYEPEKREAFGRWGAFLDLVASGVDGDTARSLVRAGLDARSAGAMIQQLARDCMPLGANVVALAGRGG